MDSTIILNNKKYYKIALAAEESDYSADYITSLARTKKITAVQLDRRWYVAADSLRSYIELQKIEQNIKQAQLRLARQQEHSVRTAIASVTTQSLTADRRGQVVALFATLVLAVVGMSVATAFLHDGAALRFATAAAIDATTSTRPLTVATDAPLAPTFTNQSVLVHVDDYRVMAKPLLTKDWIRLSYE